MFLWERCGHIPPVDWWRPSLSAGVFTQGDDRADVTWELDKSENMVHVHSSKWVNKGRDSIHMNALLSPPGFVVCFSFFFFSSLF